MRLVALASLLLSGCVSLTAVRPISTIPGVVRISFDYQTSNVFSFIVENQSGATLLVDRNAITCKQIGGERARLPGGATWVYEIPPGGKHRVNLRFALDGLHHGDPVWFHWQSALQVAGAALPVEPIEMRVE
jgi:hypothetical protein